MRWEGSYGDVKGSLGQATIPERECRPKSEANIRVGCDIWNTDRALQAYTSLDRFDCRTNYLYPSVRYTQPDCMRG